ncbi:hypothetical protein RBSH_01838 [Rhodopirellula baltica SH28]|uniref:Uncharacterized protein n=2 Tax=Rhodopirellula baltica TaxID=265606 RepID=K5D7V9_RHOBT|nr:hypothetical protein RBSH_01838 [Rhodopirellula baltica SH28]ELP34416.1 hypothetical protein RBSWK_01599 [Rhodopirellula baltica SWK14]
MDWRGINVKKEPTREPSRKEPARLHRKFTDTKTQGLRLRSIPLAANLSIWYRRTQLVPSHR